MGEREINFIMTLGMKSKLPLVLVVPGERRKLRVRGRTPSFIENKPTIIGRK